ncbi:MAG TPA: response regulator [Blastocatellia bacterium]|nr:response regulator [Blastocatellia bacterium]
MSVSVDSILIVEDNSVDLDLAIRAFGRCNLINPLRIARDAEEVIALMQRWEEGEPTPTLILLDLNLPGLSGMEVLRQIKTHDKFKTIPVIMLTSSGDEEDIQEAYLLGANSYIIKPMDFGRFRELAAQIGSYWCRVNTSPKYV